MTDIDVDHCRAVAFVICRSAGCLDKFDDAAQEACIAFIKAERKFDPAKGRDMSYADERIKGAVRDYLRVETRIRWKDKPTFIQIEEGESSKDKDGDRIGSSAGMLPPVKPHGTDSLEVEQYLSCLDSRPRWKYLIRMRFWEGETQEVVGAALNVNYARASQIERKALGALREFAYRSGDAGRLEVPANTRRHVRSAKKEDSSQV